MSQTEVDWSNIPAPRDDGAASHLAGMHLPPVPLPASNGSVVDLSGLDGVAVVYVYPMTGRPGTSLPDDWDMIPGARGCTPQSCAFRDHYAELKSLGADHLFGLSVQDSAYQKEAAERLRLPFPLLSDEKHEFGNALRLPAFEAEGKKLLKRLTLIIRDATISDVIYPVFPPDRNAEEVIALLSRKYA